MPHASVTTARGRKYSHCYIHFTNKEAETGSSWADQGLDYSYLFQKFQTSDTPLIVCYKTFLRFVCGVGMSLDIGADGGK